jgi:hypothetical protein
MPEFVFAGPYGTTYPETRDARGAHLGTVEPGDVRDLDAAPDQWWAPADEGQGGADQDGSEASAEAAEAGPATELEPGEPHDEPGA